MSGAAHSAERCVCVVQISPAGALSETFIRAHIQGLPARVVSVHGEAPTVGDTPVLSQSFPSRAWRAARRLLSERGEEWEMTRAYLTVLQRSGAEAVLAEYGPAGVRVMEACHLADVPLIVHFHGFDASVHSVLRHHAQSYPALFARAAAVIAVSRAMQARLISLGAPAEKVHYNPCGADCRAFLGADPASAPPVFLAVGRFAEKKAPQLTIAAFAEVYRTFPDARLRMVGEGLLLEQCRKMVATLGLAHAVSFLGPQPHALVQEEMRRARAFVQHSVVASTGDCEGTPLGILEAGASGLPVVATRHGGIVDVVVEGQTGYLVEEGDTAGMAQHMLRLLRQPELAASMGQTARQRIHSLFSLERSNAQLWSIIESCMEARASSPPPR